jgi:hypothetical protein
MQTVKLSRQDLQKILAGESIVANVDETPVNVLVRLKEISPSDWAGLAAYDQARSNI